MLIGQASENVKVDRQETEIFLAHLLKKDRSFIKAFPERKLTPLQTKDFNAFLKRRLEHEPLHYILGFKEFFNLKLKVDKRAMIPRSDTEALVLEVLDHAHALLDKEAIKPIIIVDVGTGSGNIAISLAKALPNSKIFAIDKSPEALELAMENIQIHKVKKQVKLLQGDLLTPLKKEVDVIVANLPYIPATKLKTLEPEIRLWEPKEALDSGLDGLNLYKRLFDQASNVLQKGGKVFYEVGGKVYSKRF